jgi:NAD-dependent deacetylase
MIGNERALEHARKLGALERFVVFTGAGVSKESGLDTFRDEDGVWARDNPEKYASPTGFRRHPREVWRWYQARRRGAADAAPNPAHRAIAALEDVVPHVTVVTQNIDGLHQEAGSTHVLELHGSLRRYKCAQNCRGNPTPVPTPPLEAEVPTRCPHCGAYTRPDVVWFHEMLPTDIWEAAIDEAHRCDAMIIVGTSGLVEPAASLPWSAKQHGALLVEINPDRTPVTSIADVVLRGPAGTMMPALLDALRAGAGAG